MESKLKMFEVAKNGGMLGLLKEKPNVVGAFFNLAHEVMHTQSAFNALDREIIGAYVSKKFGCSYCHLGHEETVFALGGEEAKKLVNNPTPELQHIFEIADKVVSNTITKEQVITFLEKGFTEQQYEDIVFVCALFGFANRMVTGFGMEYKAERDEASSRYLAKGYKFN